MQPSKSERHYRMKQYVLLDEFGKAKFQRFFADIYRPPYQDFCTFNDVERHLEDINFAIGFALMNYRKNLDDPNISQKLKASHWRNLKKRKRFLLSWAAYGCCFRGYYR